MTVLGEALPLRMDGAVRDGFRRRVLHAHDLVFRQHDDVRRVHIVEEGLVMLHHVLWDGRRQIVDLVGAGELCSFEEGLTHHCTAEALTCCVVRSYEPSWVEASSELQRELSRLMRASILRLQEHAALLGRKSALERVASLLVRLAGLRCGVVAARGPARVALPLTRREIADHLGITQETVSRSFTELKRRGAIDYDAPHEVLVNDVRALILLTGSR